MNRITIKQLNLKNILSVYSLCFTRTFLHPSVFNKANGAYKILASDSNHKTAPKTLEPGSQVIFPTGVLTPCDISHSCRSQNIVSHVNSPKISLMS